MTSPTLALRPAPTRLVLADLLPGGTRLDRPRAAVRDAGLVAGSAAFTGAMAQLSVHIPGTPVPVSGQTFAALLVGAALGPWRALSGLLLYLLAGTAGLPWFAGHEAGWGGASFGYIIGFPLAAWVVGQLAARGGDRTVARTVATMLLGTVLIYAVGVPWLAVTVHTGLSHALALGVRPFLLGDAVKIAAAAGLLPTCWALTRRLGLDRG